ncbi:MAG TPA: PIN domain-containing protein [Solirubrobacteraceae bacterium]
MSVELLLDNSAWARLDLATVPGERVDEIADLMAQRRIAVCLPFLLEAGYSARAARDHAELVEDLLALPLLHIDARIERRAIDAQGQLARAGHHRLPPVDLILAAVADVHDVGVLHYDADFDVLRERTDLRFASVWLAPRGTL